MKWTAHTRETGATEFVCEHGIGHYPIWARNTTHGCDGCCRRDDFPGREPRAGDLAVCGVGTLGLIALGGLQDVEYQDGNKTLAYVGIHMIDNKLADKGAQWSSRNPCIIGTIFEYYDKDFTMMTYASLRIIKGWPWNIESPGKTKNLSANCMISTHMMKLFNDGK